MQERQTEIRAKGDFRRDPGKWIEEKEGGSDVDVLLWSQRGNQGEAREP